jgi:hypothetical protein
VVKSQADVESKMKDRVSTAGIYLKKGMESAEDPIDVLLKDPEGYAKALVAGLADAIKRGNYKIGLERAKSRGSWKGAIPRAGAHFEERAADLVKNAMESYPARAAAIAAAQAKIKAMPSATRDQRIARSTAYQKFVGEEFDKVFGRK